VPVGVSGWVGLQALKSRTTARFRELAIERRAGSKRLVLSSAIVDVLSRSRKDSHLNRTQSLFCLVGYSKSKD